MSDDMSGIQGDQTPEGIDIDSEPTEKHRQELKFKQTNYKRRRRRTTTTTKQPLQLQQHNNNNNN